MESRSRDASRDATAAPPRPRPLARTLSWALFAAALAVNLVTMYAPSVPGPTSTLRLDLVGHALSFAALTFTGLLAGIPPRVLLALVVANAVASELVQHLLLPDRTGDVTDLMADGVGIVAGWFAHRTWRGVRERRPARPADGA